MENFIFCAVILNQKSQNISDQVIEEVKRDDEWLH